jgi:hypothetical protein
MKGSTIQLGGMLGPSSWLFPEPPDNPSNFQGPSGPYEALKSRLRPTWAQETLFEGSSRAGCKIRWFDGLSREPGGESEGQEDHEGIKELGPPSCSKVPWSSWGLPPGTSLGSLIIH